MKLTCLQMRTIKLEGKIDDQDDVKDSDPSGIEADDDLPLSQRFQVCKKTSPQKEASVTAKKANQSLILPSRQRVLQVVLERLPAKEESMIRSRETSSPIGMKVSVEMASTPPTVKNEPISEQGIKSSPVLNPSFHPKDVILSEQPMPIPLTFFICKICWNNPSCSCQLCSAHLKKSYFPQETNLRNHLVDDHFKLPLLSCLMKGNGSFIHKCRDCLQPFGSLETLANHCARAHPKYLDDLISELMLEGLELFKPVSLPVSTKLKVASSEPSSLQRYE